MEARLLAAWNLFFSFAWNLGTHSTPTSASNPRLVFLPHTQKRFLHKQSVQPKSFPDKHVFPARSFGLFHFPFSPTPTPYFSTCSFLRSFQSSQVLGRWFRKPYWALAMETAAQSLPSPVALLEIPLRPHLHCLPWLVHQDFKNQPCSLESLIRSLSLKVKRSHSQFSATLPRDLNIS